MKTSYTNKQTALTALLVLVVGANFVAGFRHTGEHATNLSQVSVDPKAGDEAVGGPEVAEKPVDGNLSRSPQPAGRAAERRDDRSNGADGAAPRREGAIPAGRIQGQGGRGITNPGSLSRPGPRAVADIQRTSVRAPEAAAVRVCSNTYSVYFEVASTSEGRRQTRLYARDQARGQTAAAVVRFSWRNVDANERDVRETLLAEMTSHLRGLPANAACESTSDEERRDRVAACEISDSGQRLNDAAAFRCRMSRLTHLGSARNGERLRGEALFAEVESIVEALKDDLRRLAANDCGGAGEDRSLCQMRGNARTIESQIVAAINRLRSQMRAGDRSSSRSRLSSTGLDRQIERLIASVRQVIPTEDATRTAETARRRTDEAREEARELQTQIRDIERDMQRECGGQAVATRAAAIQGIGACADMASALTDLRRDRLDLFSDLHAAPEFDRLLGLASRMDPREASSLIRDVRGDYMQTLNAIRGIDPLDQQGTLLMTQALQTIARGAGISQTDLATLLAGAGGAAALRANPYAQFAAPGQAGLMGGVRPGQVGFFAGGVNQGFGGARAGSATYAPFAVAGPGGLAFNNGGIIGGAAPFGQVGGGFGANAGYVVNNGGFAPSATDAANPFLMRSQTVNSFGTVNTLNGSNGAFILPTSTGFGYTNGSAGAFSNRSI